jgi:hypothetical protein
MHAEKSMRFLHLRQHLGQLTIQAFLPDTRDGQQAAIPFIDERGADGEALQEAIARFIDHTRPARIEGFPWLRGVVFVMPQDSGALALKLASRGILLVEARHEEGEVALIERLEGLLERLQGAAAHWAFVRAASAQNSVASQPPSSEQRSQSPFAQKPAYYNEAVFSEWLTRLSEPWREEDAWKSESLDR